VEVRAKGASKNCTSPTIFLQRLKPAILNLVHNLGFRSRLQKQLVMWLREHLKNCGDPCLTVECNDWCLVHNLGMGSSLPKTTFRTENGGGLRLLLGEHTKIWDPYIFLQPLKLATKIGTYNITWDQVYLAKHKF